MPTISLIATVYNEESTISALLESICRQTRPINEVVIVDGGSTDSTVDIIHGYADKLPITLIIEGGCNISEGRNIAIAAASGDVIVATDAGVRISDDWLEKLVQSFDESTETTLVAGFFHADPDLNNPFEVAMSATVLPLEEEIDPAKFLPSSRSVAFKKSAWEAVGGYPEWLDYSEDLIFDLRLKDKFGDFVFAPKAFVYFKPRTSLQSFFKQYYLYARGDGKADLWRKRHAVRYITYLVIIPVVVWLMWRIHPIAVVLYGLGGLVYLRQPYQRLGHFMSQLSFGQKMLALVYVLIIRVAGDVAKMLGYPVGWMWRLQNHPPDWREE